MILEWETKEELTIILYGKDKLNKEITVEKLSQIKLKKYRI